MQPQVGSDRFTLVEWARLETYQPAVQLMAQWAWSRPARGEPPLSPGGFADAVGISRRVMTRWLQAPVADPLPVFTLQMARQVVAATGLPLHQLLIAAQVTSPAAPLFDAPGAWAYVIAQVEQGTSQGDVTERASTLPADRNVEQWAADLVAGAATVRDLCVWYLRSVAPDGIRKV